MRSIRGAAAVALLALATTAPVAIAHGGGSRDYESTIQSVSPAVEGVRIEVVDRDDRLSLVNDSGRTVVVEGYGGEPYARLGADGAVAVNTRSPAYYLNRDRLGDVDVPETADEQAPPRWQVQDRSGRFEWHDHRIHWMGGARPLAVNDPERRTKVFDWEVPLRAGDSRVKVAGTLTWLGQQSDVPPVAAGVALAVAIAGGAALVLVVRRRRRRGDRRPADGGEAW